MAVIALTIEPFAVSISFPGRLANRLGLDLLDLRGIERSAAEHMGVKDAAPTMDWIRSAPVAFGQITTSDFSARLAELTLETALRGRALIVGSSSATILRPLAHIATVSLHASEPHRAALAKRQLCYPTVESAQLELESEDALVRRLVNRLFGDDWCRPDLADLTIDTERLCERTCGALIEQLAADVRCTQTSKTEDAILGRLRELR